MNLSNMQNVSYFNNGTDRANIMLNSVSRMCLTYSYMDELDMFQVGNMIFETRHVSALPTVRINLLKIERLAIPEHY